MFIWHLKNKRVSGYVWYFACNSLKNELKIKMEEEDDHESVRIRT